MTKPIKSPYFEEPKKETEAIFDMTEENKPIFFSTSNIFVGDLVTSNILIVINYQPKAETITMKGRIRNEDTLSKTIFNRKGEFKFNEENIQTIKNEIKEFITNTTNFPLFTKVETREVEIPPTATLDELMEHIKKSDLFDII